jgi:Winged helix-turn helix
MTTQEKLVRGKLSLLELAEYLNNVSQACKINGVSRQHFYDIRKTYEEHGPPRRTTFRISRRECGP